MYFPCFIWLYLSKANESLFKVLVRHSVSNSFCIVPELLIEKGIYTVYVRLIFVVDVLLNKFTKLLKFKHTIQSCSYSILSFALEKFRKSFENVDIFWWKFKLTRSHCFKIVSNEVWVERSHFSNIANPGLLHFRWGLRHFVIIFRMNDWSIRKDVSYFFNVLFRSSFCC